MVRERKKEERKERENGMEKGVKKSKQIAVIILNTRKEITDRFNIDTRRFKYNAEYRSKIIMDVTYTIGKLAQKENE